MSENGEIREFSSRDVSTFLHHTEIGEVIQQTTFARETYLGVARVYGLRNKEYLMENLQDLKVGDRVVLYRKYNSEDETCTAVAVQSFPDDGASIRIHTLSGLCLGYTQPPERYIMAELMKAGKHLYAKVHSLNVPKSIEELDTHNAVDLDIYWVEESNPLKIANTYELGSPKYEAMEKHGDAIWLTRARPDVEYRKDEALLEGINELQIGDRLKLFKKPTEDNPWAIEVWTDDKKYYLGYMDNFYSHMLCYMLDAGKHVYGEVTTSKHGDAAYKVYYDFDVYVEDK